MEFKDRVCCMCGEHKKFLARINGGQKLYCMQCESKITKEHGKDYWKPCSLQGFLEASLKSEKKDRSSNMLTSLKEQFQKFEEDNKKESDDKETFDHVSKYYDEEYYNEE